MVRGGCGDVATFECRECATDEWLSAARLVEHAGFCALTEGEGDCAAGAQGAWEMGRAGTAEGVGSVAGCVRRCRECARCTYVSFSLKHEDCSWFYDCDVTQLKRPPGLESFRTVRVRGLWAQSAAPSVPPPLRCPVAPLALWAPFLEAHRTAEMATAGGPRGRGDGRSAALARRESAAANLGNRTAALVRFGHTPILLGA